MNTAYLEQQKRITKAFIDFDSDTITLIPRMDVNDGMGGSKKLLQTPRAPQVVAMIEPGSSGFQEPTATDAGQQYSVTYQLLGEVDLQIAVDDVFVFDGREFKILAIMPFNGYERRAVAVSNGW